MTNPADTYDEHVIAWRVSQTLSGEVAELNRLLLELFAPMFEWISWKMG